MNKAFDSLNDEELMLLIGEGNANAFSTLVKRHTSRFYAAAFRVVLAKEDAEDVVQEAFTKLWNGKASWQEDRGARFTTWFYRIVTNQAMDHVGKRNRQRGTMLNENLPSSDPNAEDIANKREQGSAINAALAELPERQRTAVMLFYNEELSQKEAAEVMGVTPKAVESLIGRAKEALRERMRVYA
ncbi:MAG: sigma-70 family RNA polymerase sigma factor [Alphaproteobacteria bacterium]|nr:sigma-70 family RNA polymerase sigma factor [Alphaproteobacteria bacterium]